MSLINTDGEVIHQGNVHRAAGEPSFELNLVETLGVRKFLIMGLENINAQVAAIGRQRALPAKQWRDVKANADAVRAWIGSCLGVLDGMLQDAAATKDEAVSARLQQEQELSERLKQVLEE